MNLILEYGTQWHGSAAMEQTARSLMRKQKLCITDTTRGTSHKELAAGWQIITLTPLFMETMTKNIRRRTIFSASSAR